jgi:hypothetical protein
VHETNPVYAQTRVSATRSNFSTESEERKYSPHSCYLRNPLSQERLK